ncbi:MAG: hydroxymethylbilane synthase, partial [Herpetosiphon sp.]|nr:hydroxymethylbilane synthase [Herpetosiphon sp.]
MDMLRFGTRGSRLALWQTTHVMGLLGTLKPELAVEYAIISTRGDQILDTPLPLIGGKGVFTAELEAALHAKRIDCAVHSLKDLP